jgi:hypothetical protein
MGPAPKRTELFCKTRWIEDCEANKRGDKWVTGFCRCNATNSNFLDEPGNGFLSEGDLLLKAECFYRVTSTFNPQETAETEIEHVIRCLVEKIGLDHQSSP